MEPINTKNISAGIRHTPTKSSSADQTVKALNNTGVRPEFVSPKGGLMPKVVSMLFSFVMPQLEM